MVPISQTGICFSAFPREKRMLFSQAAPESKWRFLTLELFQRHIPTSVPVVVSHPKNAVSKQNPTIQRKTSTWKTPSEPTETLQGVIPGFPHGKRPGCIPSLVSLHADVYPWIGPCIPTFLIVRN